MPLSDLFRHGVISYTRNNQDRAAFASDHWVFIHIPKTAGSSFREEIANVVQPDLNIEVNYTSLDREALDEDFALHIRREMAVAVAREYVSRARFVSGHFLYRDIDPYPVFAESRLISMLRDPLARLRSDYAYRLSEESPTREAEKLRFPCFRAFVEHPANRDVMFHYLCKAPTDTAEETLRFLDERFTFVGVQEMYYFSLKSIALLLGRRIRAHLRLRESSRKPGAEVREVSSEDRRLVEILNERDYQMYTVLRERLGRVEQQVHQFVDFERGFRELNGLPLRTTA